MNILGNWSSCGNCHTGLGAVPETTASKAQLENIDCLLCHQVGYKRTKVNNVFVPDEAAMAPMTLDQAVRTVHKPVRANCLQCHAKAGGGDAYKRGDLALAHGNTTDATFDTHMAVLPSGADLQCIDCHKVANHRIAGRGSDIAPTDLDFPMGCSTAECHPTKGSPAGHTTTAVNRHVTRVACQTCHIKTYGKNANDTVATEATEFHRDWTDPHFNATANQYHPRTDLANNMIPVYKFWNKYSTNYLLYDVIAPNPVTGNYTLSRPIGSISDLTTASKLYPFKYKTGSQPFANGLNVLIAIDTKVYWATGDYLAAVAAGLVNMGFNASEPYSLVKTETHQLISHSVPPAAQTLTCNECHVSRTQMNLPNLGYKLKNTTQMICTQCHGMKDPMSFDRVHQKHVLDKNQGCSWCHGFSRPERNLNENYQAYVLTVNRPGTGNGTVTSADGGIVCGTDCTETYGANTLATLLATPALDATFTGWSGACSGKNTTCTITMNSNKEASATFTPTDTVPAEAVLYIARDSINFGKIRIEKTRAKTLILRNKGTADLIITEIRTDNPSFAADWVGQIVVKPRKSYRLKVSFTPPSVGIHTGFLTIISNDAQSPARLALSGEGR